MNELEFYYDALRLRQQHGSRARLQASLKASRALSLGKLNERDYWDKLRSIISYLEKMDEQSAA
jgi:hypothetical protein